MAIQVHHIADADIRDIAAKAKAVIENDDRYEIAATNKLSADKQLALALFDVASSNDEKTVNQTCSNLGLNSKKGTSVFYKIARIAFHKANEDLNTPKENRPQISKYATVLKGAFHQKLTRDEFEKQLKDGFDKALKSLRRALKGNDLDTSNGDVEKKALDHISADFGHYEIDAKVADLEDGNYVELVGRVENGKLVVYGVLPKKSNEVKEAVVSNWIKAQPKPYKVYDLFREIGDLTKVLIADKDDAFAIVNTNDGLNFEIASKSAYAFINSSKSQADFDKKKISLSGANIAEISDDIRSVFKNEDFAIDIKGKKLVVTPTISEITDIVDKNQMPQFGAVKDDAVVFDIKSSEEIERSTYHQNDVHELILSKEQIAEIDGLKLKDGSINYFDKGTIKLKKSEIRIIKRAAKALKKLGNGNILLKHSNGCLSLEADYNGFAYAVFVSLEAK
ncbi:hypothetical protein [Terasakiella pusilla]|uniref:hypothetical protein n=1 Tax=Terasakiella pusilla TaxID=64973 RepID=UPI003AA7FE78